MILLWGLPGDDPFDAVASELQRRGADVAVLDQREVLDMGLELDLGNTLGGSVWSRSQRVALAEVRALYTRVYDARQLRRVAEAGRPAWDRIEQVETALWAWADEAPAVVVNRPTAMSSNGSKPYQLAMLAEWFRVPETLITTDPDAAREFWDRHRDVVYKSVSGVRSRVSRLGIDHQARLADVAWCPTQFQRWIPGRDHRVHVVGDEVFPVEIVSDADDYRYASRNGFSCELRATTLPADVADRARAATTKLGLELAGLDLRRTPDGEWFCFEVNTSPCFTYYERHTGQPLTAAVASLLARHQ